ncbi:LOW QUALITY PROTEIN: hypothetical protein YC2023_072785 [Brassica napus]
MDLKSVSNIGSDRQVTQIYYILRLKTLGWSHSKVYMIELSDVVLATVKSAIANEPPSFRSNECAFGGPVIILWSPSSVLHVKLIRFLHNLSTFPPNTKSLRRKPSFSSNLGIRVTSYKTEVDRDDDESVRPFEDLASKHQPPLFSTRHRSTSINLSGTLSGNEPAEALIRRKVWTKWPEDNNFMKQ